MRLTTTPHELDAHFDDARADGKPGVFARVYARIIAAQERRARRIVHGYLARGSDAELARLGFTTTQIANLRATAPSDPIVLL